MSLRPVLAVTGVSKSYAGTDAGLVEVLNDVNLTLGPGEKASLVGPSGGGKSTLLSLIAGLLRPDAGTVEVDGISLASRSEHERARVRASRVGIALQSDNLIPFLSARENVELALSFGRRTHRRRARAAALSLLDRLTVAHRSDHLPRHLSGGETQRVALAVAMANQPVLLLADEIAAELDRETAAHVIDEVLTADSAVLYVTHDIALADRVASRYELTDHYLRRR